MTDWAMNEHTLNFIARTADKASAQTDIVIQGPIITCMLSHGKNIVFRPQLTKVQDLFHVEMKLISTYNTLSVKVHFNVECKKPSNYHISLHPRLMDVKWNNTFYITLPFINIESGKKQVMETETISLALAIMIHNVEDFEVNVNDLDVANTIVKANMSSSAQSYRFPDILSIFYGVSNSVVSVLDSITDIMFIAFLLALNSVQNGENKQISLLLVLSIGNMVSVAIAISVYVTNKIEMTSIWKTNAYRILFFVLSPGLAAFDWLLQRIQTYQSEAIVLAPETDGLLMWFQEELIRNEIFLLETVFESCFQIIIQLISVFVVEGFQYKDVYLYSSIMVSLLVIISKFILISYNAKRTVLFWNVFSYSLDVYFSLIFGVFIAASVFQKKKK
eukprot:349275_1